MKKIFLIALFAVVALTAGAQVSIAPRQIPYNIKYHWGIIDVMIASGNVKFQSDETGFYGTLDGTSIPWEGRVICVSDTLQGRMENDGGLLRERVIYQNGWYRHPHADDFHSAGYNAANPLYYKNIAGEGEYNASSDSMEAITVTSDMIGMYYLANVLNFPQMRPGERVSIPIEGPYSHEVVITYQGEGTYDVNGQSIPTYDCTFEYGYDGSMSGYPVECKIGVSDRIPLFFSASLPLGHIELLYAP